MDGHAYTVIECKNDVAGTQPLAAPGFGLSRNRHTRTHILRGTLREYERYGPFTNDNVFDSAKQVYPFMSI